MSYISMPYESGKIQFHNRLILPPIVTNKADAAGEVTAELLEHYDALTRGGYFSAAVIENAYISTDGKFDRRQLSIESDDVMEGLSRLAETVRRNGVKCILQINHAGVRANSAATGALPIGPSDVVDADGKIHARAMNHQDISDVVGLFRSTAVRAQKAGLDGIEIHSAHGFLLNQFYSPLVNKRDDEYGGDVSGRIRIHIEIINTIREAVSDRFIISLRLGACDYHMPGGTTIEDSKVAAVAFEKAGADLLSISGGLSGFMIPGDNSQGYFSPLSSAIKQVVSLPVLLTGGITEPSAANRLLMEQKADFVGIGRAMLKDTGWAKRAMEV